MATLPFTKMHGLGNDYVYVNGFEHSVSDPEALARRIADRHFGVGGDGLVLILPSTVADARMRMFNADGSEAEMCGNAVRCVAKYLFERGIVKKPVIALETKAGMKQLNLRLTGDTVSEVTVDMGEPILRPELVPVNLPGERAVDVPIADLPVQLRATCVSMGNPHAVIFVDQITDDLVLGIGPRIERHPLFPRRINVEFVRVISRTEVEMRVWERGSGETLACGTGAAAVAVAGALTDRTDRKVTVHLRGGDLRLEWNADNHVLKTGPATFVFDGQFQL